jgi:hypothetical protein
MEVNELPFTATSLIKVFSKAGVIRCEEIKMCVIIVAVAISTANLLELSIRKYLETLINPYLLST